MKKSLKSGLSFLLSFLLITTPAFAERPGSVPADLKDLSPSEKIRDVYDLLRPTRRGDTLSEMYYRVSTRLDAEEAAFLGKKLEKQGGLKTPQLKLLNDEIVVQQEGRELRIGYREKNGDAEILLNGKVLSESEINSPAKRWAMLESLLTKKNASHPLVALFLPDAQAFNWVMAAAIGAAALGAFLIYKKNKKASEPAKCSVSTPSCCSVNGGYVMHSNACCQEIGGLGLGTGVACPANAGVTSSTTTAPAAGASSTGQR